MADDTGEALLKVAREILAKRGYVGLTMKTAAAAAGVTPDVARRYYRNRDALVVAALKLPSNPIAAIPTLVAPGVEGMGERLVRYMLDILRDPQTRDELVSLARTGVNAGHAMAGLQDFLERAIVDRMTSMLGVPDARMRSALITSYLLGVAMTRYGVRLEPLASASEEEVVRMVAPVIQDLLDPRKPLAGSSRPRSREGSAAPTSAPEATASSATTSTPTSAPAPAAPAGRRFDPDPKATAQRAADQATHGPSGPAPASSPSTSPRSTTAERAAATTSTQPGPKAVPARASAPGAATKPSRATSKATKPSRSSKATKPSKPSSATKATPAAHASAPAGPRHAAAEATPPDTPAEAPPAAEPAPIPAPRPQRGQRTAPGA